MHSVGKYVVYRKEVCEILGINYYVLVPVNDKSLKLQVPIDENSYLRDLVSKEEMEKVIDMIPKIEVINTTEKLIENEYERLMNSGSFEDLIKIIKTTYLRNKNR